MITKRQNRKDHSESAISLFIRFSAIGIILVFSHAKLILMYVNPKHEIGHKPLVLCRSLLSSIGPFSAPQAEYSAYTYSIQNSDATATVKLENTSNQLHKGTRKRKASKVKNFATELQKPQNHVTKENNEIHYNNYY